MTNDEKIAIALKSDYLSELSVFEMLPNSRMRSGFDRRMKKIILSCAAALLAIGSAHATPKFLSLNNKHGKTTIKIEIPASDRDETNGLSIEDVVLYNSGKTFQAKSVDAIWGDNSTVILQFEKLTAFEDCTLSFSLNGEPVSLDIQSCLADRK